MEILIIFVIALRRTVILTQGGIVLTGMVQDGIGNPYKNVFSSHQVVLPSLCFYGHLVARMQTT